MFEKGELLLAYDESEMYKQEIEFVKENWGEFKEMHGRVPTDEAVEKVVWNRLSDGWLYQDAWENFKVELTHLMEERNPRMMWESPDSQTEESGEDRKFQVLKGEDLLHRFVDFEARNNISYIKIFAYGKDGFCIDPEWQGEKCVLAACKNGFYRDWDKGGVCIGDTREEE
jgi:hypothetical protein